jgi:hypothetical protein
LNHSIPSLSTRATRGLESPVSGAAARLVSEEPAE